MVCAIVLLFYCCFAIVGLRGDPHGDRVPVVSGDGDCFPPPPRLAGLGGMGISGDRGGDDGVSPGDPRPRPRCHFEVHRWRHSYRVISCSSFEL